MKHLLLFFISCSLLAGCSSTVKRENSPAPPNIIIVLTDDQGYGDFGVTGNHLIETPTINSFASESVSFDRFYVSPVCAPTRASLMTGRYFMRTGVTGVTHGAETMNSEEVTIAELLRANGYATGCFGKWHNGSHYPYDPMGQGFDEFWGFNGGIIRNYFDTRLIHNSEVVQTEGYLVDFLTDKAIEFIESNKERPFFCYIPYNVPHTPIQAPDSLFEKYLAKELDEYTAGIYAMCETVDTNFKKLLTRLSELNLEENTIVIYFTDNGPNGQRYNAGMKGTKSHVDEGGIRAPLWVRWKGELQPRIVSQLADHIDILPTVLDICEISIPDSLSLDGISLKSLLYGEPGYPEDRLFYTYNNEKGAVRDNQFRFVVEKGTEKSLYDMIADPSQLKNIAPLFPEKTEKYFNLYQEWFNDVSVEHSGFPMEVGHNIQPIVDLPVSGGQLSGNLRYKNIKGYAYDWAVNWTTAEDRFSWKIKVVDDGLYEFFLQYLIQPGWEGAEIEVEIGGQSLAKITEEPFIPLAFPDRDLVKRGRVLEMNWKNFSWGKLHLEKGEYEITVKATNIPGPEVGELYGIRLQKR